LLSYNISYNQFTWDMSRDIDKIKLFCIMNYERSKKMEPLVAQKMLLESQWNASYTTTGVYSIEMKHIEKKIDAIKQVLILKDISKAKQIR